MWRLYAPGKEGVAVATSFGKLNNLVNNSNVIRQDWLAGAARVKYINHFDESLIRGLPAGERLPNTMMPFMLKNISYQHEKEVRALICAPTSGQMPAEGFDLPLDVLDFVDSIVVNPFCQAWFAEAVTNVADRFGLSSKIRKSLLSPERFYMNRTGR